MGSKKMRSQELQNINEKIETIKRTKYRNSGIESKKNKLKFRGVQQQI